MLLQYCLGPVLLQVRITFVFFEINLLSFFKSVYVYDNYTINNYTFAKKCTFRTAEPLLVWT